MISKAAAFDALVASVTNGDPHTQPLVGCSYHIKGYSFHVEASLYQDAKAQRVMARMESAEVRFFYPNHPAKRIRGPLCIVSLLHHGRLVELFCLELHGGMVVMAIYFNEPIAAYQLIDQVYKALITPPKS